MASTPASSASIVEHPRVSCDASKQSPLTGVRYKKLGQNYDLCEAEFLKLPVDDRAQYIAVVLPQATEAYDNVKGNPELKVAQDAVMDILARMSLENREQFMSWTYKVELPLPDGTLASQKPPLPPSQPPPSGNATAPSRPRQPNTNIHAGVTCDASGMSPITGDRWKKIDNNYDLCDAEFQKLSSEEQSNFVCLAGGPPSITILSPTVGTSWPMGSIQQIEWETTGTISAVKIQYAEKSWSSWLYDWSELAISGRTDGKIPNTGKCRWRVPSEGVKAGTKMYFRVSSEQHEDPAERNVYADSGLFEVVAAVPGAPEEAPANTLATSSPVKAPEQ